ncbi:hypothetical protein EVAR_84784_1 [Eumeta japonica]|uniref:Uncharacterized protein n=1 Tax=Eumeta variegata TaxID=151549 RepID=A0A4C1U9H5_EUMVA|nr:hypothetical protein EVAR_84784_1 [Eumeta japonica]
MLDNRLYKTDTTRTARKCSSKQRPSGMTKRKLRRQRERRPTRSSCAIGRRAVKRRRASPGTAIHRFAEFVRRMLLITALIIRK